MVAAQTTQPPSGGATSQQPTAQQPASQSASEAKVVLTGCLRQGATPTTFILADASPAASSAGAASGSKPGAVGTAGMMKSYALVVAKPGEDLAKHLNHRVEVTGTAGPMKPGASSGAGASSGTQSGSTAKSGAAQQPTETLNVQSFKMVAATCP
jgi:hypothetical protein